MRVFRAGYVAIVASTVIAASAGAQNPPSAPAPTPSTHKPWPTLMPVKADPTEIIHVVKRGDTLWDLAKAYLKDPFKWPQVFRRNTDVVENPHWIYPGEPIRIPSSEVRPEVLARIATKPAPSSEQTVFATQPLGLGPDRLNAGGVLGRMDVPGVPTGEIEAAPFAMKVGGPGNHGRLAAAYDRPGIKAAAGERRFQLQDRLFIEIPKGFSGGVGELLLAYRLGPELDDIGQLVIPTGIVRVESAASGELALGRVLRQFGEITLGQSVIPLESIPPSVGNPVAITPGPAERVVYVAGDPVLPSLQNYVILTSKSVNGVKVGDQFTLIDDSVDPKYPAPAVAGAIVEVVRVTPYAVTAIVVDHEQPRIYAGMLARITAKGP